MALDSAPVRPKRSRQDVDDASSPQAAAASTKKRKISGTTQLPPPPPSIADAPEPATSARGRGRGRGGRRATSGRGRGRGRGGSSRGGSRVASQETTTQGAAPGGRPDPYELPDSEDERVAVRTSTVKKPRGSATKTLGSSSRGGRAAGSSIGVVYDLPASGEQLLSPSKVASHVSGNGNTPRKPLPTGRGVAAASSPAPAPREEGDAGSPGGDMELDPPPLSGSQQALPRQRAKRILEPSVTVVRGPTKLTKLKSILTPHKAKGINAARKSVAFDGEDMEDQEMSFADVPTTSKKKATPVSVLSSVGNTPGSSGKRGRVSQREEAQAAAAAAAEEEDDVVCVICSRPESEPPNEILFCDKCDKGFHQQCYDVPVIPEGDWLCRSCLGDATGESVITAVSAPRQQKQQQQHSPSIVVTSSKIPDIANFGDHLRALQRLLLSRCTGSRRIKLRGQDEAYSSALQLVEQTVLAGEGNSMLVIGARGCGKTTLIEGVISELSEGHKNDFHVVRLNGFIHTDDKIALREIWRQLGKEMEVEDELVNKTNNYADTLASLLAVLSHPSEIAGADAGVTSRSVVFIMDEFDLFTTHGRQTLLYNLFDIAQAKKAPIAVVGLTTKVDVVESLEKRVKSRFSHRYVYLSLPKTLGAYWDVCRQGLTVDYDDIDMEGYAAPLAGRKEFYGWWDKEIEAMRQTRAFQDHLEYYYYTSKSVGAFLASCILPLSMISPTEPWVRMPAGTGAAGLSLEAPDSKLMLMESLSDLDLALLISAARLDVVAHMDTPIFAELQGSEAKAETNSPRLMMFRHSAQYGAHPLALRPGSLGASPANSPLSLHEFR
ncbi:origin recognition complex subunit 4 [Magnaporthiopsis poae ATCC 64411]|uniref:Origin recognition complex subunit 4 n=1 Tax=Magnaporthiopsis poae (strain ATCC 64411 / 73-15) TaxID=644358 RepID=A0A0C4DYU9_MAGP6|nr:origin recognition complex subunit 4 [Magnaporthiopsis poae ATCC 64411]